MVYYLTKVLHRSFWVSPKTTTPCSSVAAFRWQTRLTPPEACMDRAMGTVGERRGSGNKAGCGFWG